jgi:hypothetical protein
MRIGFDAKRAFTNNTGLGNYSRDTIRILSNLYRECKFFAYTPIKTKNRRLEFIENQKNIFIRSPKNLIGEVKALSEIYLIIRLIFIMVSVMKFL